MKPNDPIISGLRFLAIVLILVAMISWANTVFVLLDPTKQLTKESIGSFITGSIFIIIASYFLHKAIKLDK